MGNPIRMCEMLSTLDGTLWAERVAISNPKSILKAKLSLKRVLQIQLDNNWTGARGTFLVEILIGCPTNCKMSAQRTREFVGQEMTDTFPIGVFKAPRKGSASLGGLMSREYPQLIKCAGFGGQGILALG